MSGFLPNPIHDQQQVAHHFFLDGSIMFLGNLIVGLLVYSKYPGPTPYSRTEAISYGAPIILAGLILTQTQIIGKLNTVELFFVWIGQESAWTMWIVQIVDGLCLFWGTNQSNKSVVRSLPCCAVVPVLMVGC